jgi:hypothetical protein
MLKNRYLFFIACTILLTPRLYGQANFVCTNAAAEQVMTGNYSPATYQASTIINDPNTISQEIMARVSPDSMLAYLRVLSTFQTRNSGSDTTSAVRGIGAARRWIHSKFEDFSASNENRLLVSYLQFDQAICYVNRHSNVMAVLPGNDITDKSIVIVEAHMDSRCDILCDTSCQAEGMEDNASGTALVMELARVMSKYSFNHTIVFTTVTAEEQGLLGAEAFADYIDLKGIKVRCVLNNDVIGGVICGQTASPPGCPGLNSVDSTNVRLFSFGGFNSPHKQLSRFIKLEYKEQLASLAAIPMGIHIMTDEDRTGRGGDHIPFRQHNHPAMRFTCANEHGDASNGPGYTDRQHTSTDILGVDTDNDQVIDSFFVNFNYLARNTVINGNALAMAALGPKSPDLTVTSNNPTEMTINIFDANQYNHYRVGVRTTTNDWDSVYTFTGTSNRTITVPQGVYIVSAASVDNKNVESLFSREVMVTTGVNDIMAPGQDIALLQNSPNPFDEATMISVAVNKTHGYKEAFISISDITGKEVKRIPVQLKQGINEVVYDHGYNMAGTFTYTLVADGKPLQSRKMVFAY